MIQKIRMLSAGLLLLAAQTFAQGTTRATRSGDNYTLSNGAVEAVFSGQGRFDIEKLTLNGKSVLGAGANLAPWILYYKGPQGENPCLMPEHAAYDGAAIRDDDEGKTLVFTWQLTLDYSAERYPVRMYVSLPDDSELLRWNIEADLPEGWMVTDLEFPRITIDRPAGGKVLTTEGWGVEKPLAPPSRRATRRTPRPCSSSSYTTPKEPSTTARRTAGAAARPTRRSARATK